MQRELKFKQKSKRVFKNYGTIFEPALLWNLYGFLKAKLYIVAKSLIHPSNAK